MMGTTVARQSRARLFCARTAFLASVVLALCLRLPVVSADTPEPEAERSDFLGEVKLLLPREIYAVPGVEMNLYFDNVVQAINPANYAFDVTCARGTQQNERWTFTPGPGDVGRHFFRLEVLNQNNEAIARGSSTIVVAPADAGAGQAVSLLIIGDSLTAASVYSQQVVDLCSTEGNPSLTLIGSVQRGEEGKNRHEGYGGWTAQRFAAHYEEQTHRTVDGRERRAGSPFVYAGPDGQPGLDFARYCRELNDGKAPDFVTILLGCNDTFSSTDQTIEERIDLMFTHYDMLLAMIHGFDRNTRIGALLLVPAAATQDAFGANYRCGQTRWQYKRNQHRVVERMMQHYGNREHENIFLVPANVNLDCVNNYPSRSGPWNARTTQTGNRQSNGVHPAADGYRQIGDSVYCWLKHRWAAGNPDQP